MLGHAASRSFVQVAYSSGPLAGIEGEYNSEVPPIRRSLLLLGIAVVLGSAWFAPLDSSASRYAEAGLKRALVSFATARTLNAVISVVQGTQVSVQPGGVGVTFTPGQALDPINDLVEQFSLLMLGASVSFGVQLALIKFGAYWAVSLMLTAVALAWAWSAWRRPPAQEWLTRFLLALLLVRFAMPLIALGSEAAFELFLAEDYAAGQARIEFSAGEIANLAAASTEPAVDESVTDKMKRWWSQNTDVKKRFEELKEIAGRTIEHIIKLIVVFVLQTLVLPLLLLWMLLRLVGALAALSRRER